MKSAFVIKKGAYEKLVCAKCESSDISLKHRKFICTGTTFNEGAVQVNYRLSEFTPVTLSCEAFCSICDEAI
jgi:hypothetical protein